MKAYAYVDRVGLDALQLVERPDPAAPGPREIVLKLRAAALNYRDLAIAAGTYHVGVCPPLVPLSDGAGEVVAAGSKVTRFRVGDLACPVYLPDWLDGPISPRVARRRLGGPSDGVLQEFMRLSEEEAVRAPHHLAPVEAACLPVTAVTAWRSLYEVGALAPGDSLVVQGAGGLSTAAIQFAAAGGAHVISLVRCGEHQARLRELGAHEVVVSADSADWTARILELSGGLGADAALNVAGG